MLAQEHRRRFLTRLGYGGLGLGATIFSATAYGSRIETDWLQLKRVSIPIAGLPTGLDGLVIVLMSDFHLYPHTRIELIRQAVAMANDCQPDLVILGGDYVLRTADSIFALAPALAQLNPRFGIFAILGNHDHWKGVDTVEEGLIRSGITVLRNRGLSLALDGGSQVFLAGVDDGWVGKNDLAAALQGRPPKATTIVLMHEPDFADEWFDNPQIQLQLSGHSHGGQVRLPLLGSPFLPPYGRKYDKGLYRVGPLPLYTNVGIGVTAPIRLNCPPEVTQIRLVAETVSQVG